MANIETTYLGLKLKSPILVGSSGLSLKKENLSEMEKNGAGAIVLKSLFEEQIRNEYISQISESANYPEADDYIRQYTEQNETEKYLELIKNAKQNVSIPIIASINCYSNTEWINYADKIAKSGADALEINLFYLPSDENISASEIEKKYMDIVEKVVAVSSIPIAIKMGFYFTDLARFAVQLSWRKVAGIVLFNRPYSPDININNETITHAGVFSNSSDISLPIRWTALLTDKVQCDICASTGVHDGEGVVKLLLTGANAVQVTSAIYHKGIVEISKMNDFLNKWMDTHNYKTISDFRGKIAFRNMKNLAAFERVQFMKYYSGIE